jgi:hypothetical protein
MPGGRRFWEEGEESVGGGSPSLAGLGQVLEAGEDEQSLRRGVGDDRGRLGRGAMLATSSMAQIRGATAVPVW